MKRVNFQDLRARAIRRHRRLQTDRIRRRAGRAMLGISVVGVVVAIVGTVVAWRLIGTVNRATSDTLDVTVDALESTERTLDVADGLVSSTSTALTDLTSTLDSLSASLETGDDVVVDAGDLTETAGPTMTEVARTFRQLEGLGTEIDSVLRGIANVPFGPSFDPDANLGTTFGRLADDLEPLSSEFTETAESLDEFSGSLTELRTDVDRLSETIDGINDELDTGEPLLEEYRTNVETAREVAEETQRDLDRDQTQLRLIVLIAGVNFAAAQIVPFWLGSELLLRRGDEELTDEELLEAELEGD